MQHHNNCISFLPFPISLSLYLVEAQLYCYSTTFYWNQRGHLTYMYVTQMPCLHLTRWMLLSHMVQLHLAMIVSLSAAMCWGSIWFVDRHCLIWLKVMFVSVIYIFADVTWVVIYINLYVLHLTTTVNDCLLISS